MKTIFLLQDTKEANEELKAKFDSERDYRVVGTSTDGEEALSLMSDLNPDFLIVNLILTGCDGLSVIEKVRRSNDNVKIVVLSALLREEIVSMVVQAGANYFMAKPYSFTLLLQRLGELEVGQNNLADTNMDSRIFKKYSIDERISKIFISVGIPPHIKGYGFLREGVKMTIEEPDMINNITKRLYPKIGEKYKTTASKVERAIRHAIEVAWSRGRIETINNILGVQAYVNQQKPTNGEFIALVADKMMLECK